jgi:hypothetical protein
MLLCIFRFGHAAWRPSQSHFCLEAQKPSESCPQIVAYTLVEVHFIAHIKPQTNWPDPSLDSSPG